MSKINLSEMSTDDLIKALESRIGNNVKIKNRTPEEVLEDKLSDLGKDGLISRLVKQLESLKFPVLTLNYKDLLVIKVPFSVYDGEISLYEEDLKYEFKDKTLASLIKNDSIYDNILNIIYDKSSSFNKDLRNHEKNVLNPILNNFKKEVEKIAKENSVSFKALWEKIIYLD